MLLIRNDEMEVKQHLKGVLDSGRRVKIYLKDGACCSSAMREEFEKSGYLISYKRDNYYVVMCEGCTLSIGLFRDMSELESLISRYELY